MEDDFGIILYKRLWTTKGSRFTASHRLLKTQKLSFATIGCLSAYVIIINLIGLANILQSQISVQMIALITTALSILILVFSQLESSKEYSLHAEKLHDCAKEIGNIYTELQETMRSKKTIEAKELIYSSIGKRYNDILSNYENHRPIDYRFHCASNPKDYDLSRWKVFYYKIQFYLLTYFFYHSLILIPPTLLITYLINYGG